MAAVSVLDDVIAALVTIFQGAAGASVPVYDGLPVTAQADLTFVVVGDDAAPTTQAPAGLTVQTNEPFRFTEIGDVNCALICQSGDDDLPGLRATSRTLMLALEAAIRADRTLGGVVILSSIEQISLFQQRQNGSDVRRVFTVHYEARQG